MKMSDVLRDLADLLDQKSAEVAAPVDQPIVTVQDAGVPTDDKESEVGRFIPPLQAKLEILKKSEGVPNVYDEQGQGQDNEIELMKKRAGITAVQHEASEDNDITG